MWLIGTTALSFSLIDRHSNINAVYSKENLYFRTSRTMPSSILCDRQGERLLIPLLILVFRVAPKGELRQIQGISRGQETRLQIIFLPLYATS